MNTEQMRCGFEKWFAPDSKESSYWLRRGANGQYRNPSTQSAWQGWQAALRQAVPEGFVAVPKEPTGEQT